MAPPEYKKPGLVTGQAPVVKVEFTPRGKRYSYIAGDPGIKVGDHCLVTVGEEEKEVLVVSAESLPPDQLPFPLESMKKAGRAGPKFRFLTPPEW